MNRILITGASGDLGRPLSGLAAQREEVISVFLTNPNVGGGLPVQADLTEYEDVQALATRFQPTAIIHAAVSDRNQISVITTAAHNLVKASQSVGARLIALSTDMIFDGTQPPYSENADASPLSAYGRAKAESEAVISQGLENHVIVRTSLIYEFHARNRQVSWMLDRYSSGLSIPLFVDEMRSPIHACNLAEALIELASNDFTGTLNIAGPEALSRFDYGMQLLEAVEPKAQSRVEKTLAAEVAPQRPRDLTLDVTLAQACLNTSLLTIRESAVAFAHRPTAT
jgi:dTDP-4-dehydrorhamnose reductase